jgi:hypothetical protein
MTTICPNCKDAGCALLAATQREYAAWVAIDGSDETAGTWKRASDALSAAQSDCAHRAAYSKTDLSARLDRIEAVLREKGLLP